MSPTILYILLYIQLLPALLFKRSEYLGLITPYIERRHVLKLCFHLLIGQLLIIFEPLIQLGPLLILKLHALSVESQDVLHGGRTDPPRYLETLVLESLRLGVPQEQGVLLGDVVFGVGFREELVQVRFFGDVVRASLEGVLGLTVVESREFRVGGELEAGC